MIALLALTLHVAAAPAAVARPAAGMFSAGGPSVQGQATEAAASNMKEARGQLALLRSEIATIYLELAEWCHDAKLYGQRDLLFEALLAVEPDHAEARKWLGYRWDRKNAAWERGAYRAPKNTAHAAVVTEYEAERDARTRDIRARLLELVWLPGMGRDEREREVRLYLPLAPEDSELRRALGQVAGEGEGVWLLADAVRTRARRAELLGFLAAARASVPPLEPWEVDAPASEIELRWTEAWKTPVVKVTGTVTGDEIRESAMIVHTLCQLLPAALPSQRYVEPVARRGRRTPRPAMLGKYAVYLLRSPAENSALLDHWPDLTDRERELFAGLSTAVLDGDNSIGAWPGVRRERTDGLARQVIGIYLRDQFSISTRHGWVWEGLGLYLTHFAIGTRLTFFVGPSTYVGGNEARKLWAQRLMEPKADWLAILLEEMQAQRPPRLAFLVGKDVNAISVRELLLAYGFAAYLLELHPDVLLVVLERLGRGEAPVEVLESELGRRLPEIERDLLEWLQVAKQL